MADSAHFDANHVPGLMAVSNADGVSPVAIYGDPATHRLLTSSAGGSGTVTEVDTGTGLTGGPITTTGTIQLDSKLAPMDTLTGNSLKVLRVNAGETAVEYATASTGTVTTTGSPANGNLTKFSGASSITNGDLSGDITTSGTLATTLATVNSNVGSFTNASVTVNGKGLITAASSGTAPVTAVSVATANGFAGSSSGGATPALTLSTTVTGTLQGNGTAISASKITLTQPATGSTLTIVDGKTLTQNNTLTYSGTDGSSVAFGTGGTVLYTASTVPLTVGNTTIASGTNGRVLYDNSGVLGEMTNTGSGTVNVLQNTPTLTTPVLGVATATSINGNTFTTGTYTLTGAASKTLTFNNSITLAGTDATTMTFPSTTATIARTDAAQTFTGTQTFALVVETPQTVTVTSNAGTCDVTHGIQNFTNSSASAMTITLTTTSAVDGQKKIVRIYDATGVAEGITWVNTENSTVTAPATSNGSTTLPLTVGFMFNGSTSKWRCIASA